MPPGAGEPLTSEAQIQTALQSAADDCGALLASLKIKLDRHVVDCLATCGTTMADCESCLRGKIAVTIDEAGAKSGKCLDKLQSYAYGKLAAAHSYVRDILGPLPDVETAKLATVMPASEFAQIVAGSVQQATAQNSLLPPVIPPAPIPPAPPVPQPFPGSVPCPPDWLGPGPCFAPAPIPSKAPGPVPGGFDVCAVTGPGLPHYYNLPPGSPPTPPPDTWIPQGERCDIRNATAVACYTDGTANLWCGGPLTVPPQPTPAPSPVPPGPTPTEPVCCPVETASTPGTAVCPAPATPAKCEDQKQPHVGAGLGLDWNLKECPDTVAFIGGGITIDDATLKADAALNLTDSQGNKTWPSWIKAISSGIAYQVSSVAIVLPFGLDRAINPLATALGRAFGNVLYETERGIVDGAISYTGTMLNNNICALPASVLFPTAVRGVFSFIDRWIGVDTKEAQLPWSYLIGTVCATALPSQADIHILRSKDLIGEKTWRCWTRALNNLDKPQELVYEATRARPPIFDAIQMMRRDIISPSEMDELFKWSGFRKLTDIDNYVKVTEQIPGPSDLVRFMVRDVADPKVVEKYKLGAEFPDKFQGDVKRWAEWQGLATNVMEYNWYAHWIWPSANQLYEMLFRLREDSPNRPADVQPVTLDDVKEVLGIQDYAPVWRARLAAIAQRPLTRIDIRRMHQQGVLTDAQLIPYYMDLGYSRKDANGMAEFTKTLTRQYKCKLTQYAGPKQIASSYVKGLIGYEEARNVMETTCLTPQQIDDMLGQADLLRQIEVRGERVKAIKRRYASCEFDTHEAISALLSVGVQQEKAAVMVDEWRQSACSKGKEATASMLCKWFTQGILSATDYLYRLRKLGFTLDDANHIVASCAIDAANKAKPKGGTAKPPKAPASSNGKQ
jgi:hypothetical protein